MSVTSEDSYLSWPAAWLQTKEPLEGAVYLCVGHKMVCFRPQGEFLGALDYDRLLLKKVKTVFVEEKDFENFKRQRGRQLEAENELVKNWTEEARPLVEKALDLRRAAFDVLTAVDEKDPATSAAVKKSKELVQQFMAKPHVIQNVAALQRYEQGTVDHSVNVAVVSVFLGLRMGYTSRVILEHLALGGLFHDLGKTLAPSRNRTQEGESQSPREDEDQAHPSRGEDFLSHQSEIAKEVRMIVAQHHEYHDGSGYPHGLKGQAIYDLARLVSLVNQYDHEVSLRRQQAQTTGGEPMLVSCRKALEALEGHSEKKFEPQKWDKAKKILKFSLS